MKVGDIFTFEGKQYKVKDIRLDNTDFKYIITTNNKCIYEYQVEMEQKRKLANANKSNK